MTVCRADARAVAVGSGLNNSRQDIIRIDRIELYHVAMPLIYPWRTAYGEDAAIESVLCRMTSGSVEAWGESAPFAAGAFNDSYDVTTHSNRGRFLYVHLTKRL